MTSNSELKGNRTYHDSNCVKIRGYVEQCCTLDALSERTNGIMKTFHEANTNSDSPWNVKTRLRFEQADSCRGIDQIVSVAMATTAEFQYSQCGLYCE